MLVPKKQRKNNSKTTIAKRKSKKKMRVNQQERVYNMLILKSDGNERSKSIQSVIYSK